MQTTVANSTKEEEPKLKITAAAAAASGVLPVRGKSNLSFILHGFCLICLLNMFLASFL